jgi:hypothetical protein
MRSSEQAVPSVFAGFVRGVDRRGTEVRIDRGYISEGLRMRVEPVTETERPSPYGDTFDTARDMSNARQAYLAPTSS